MKESKYPFLFVHGMFFKDFVFIKAFGNIELFLKEKGYRVYTSLNDGMGTSETNSYQIKEQILKILEDEKTDKINLIGYSKGGLDIAYLASNLGIEDKIASITMISVPFKGSPICHFSTNVPYIFFAPFVYFVNFMYKNFFLDSYPNCLQAFKEMRIPENNEICLKDIEFTKKIYTQSYSTEIKNIFADKYMIFPAFIMKYILARNKEIDGFLIKDSAKFVNYKGDCIKGEDYSHTEIADFLTSKKKKKKMFEFWVNLLDDLIDKGF